MGKRYLKHVEALSFNKVKVIVKRIKLVRVIKLKYDIFRLPDSRPFRHDKGTGVGMKIIDLLSVEGHKCKEN
jgi:hypothetical protein